jgi:hypothetical protein
MPLLLPLRALYEAMPESLARETQVEDEYIEI